MFDYNETMSQLNKAIQEYNDAVWKWLPQGGQRYMPELDLYSGLSEWSGVYKESGVFEFRDQFHPIVIRTNSLQSCMEQGLAYLQTFTEYMKSGKVDTWFVVTPYRGKPFVAPFVYEDFRKWKIEEHKYVAYPTKEEAQTQCR